MNNDVYLKSVHQSQSTSNANPPLKETVADSPIDSQSNPNLPIQQLPIPQVKSSRKGHKKAKQKRQWHQSHSVGVDAPSHVSDDDATRELLARTGFASNPIVILALPSLMCDCSTSILDSSGIGPPHINLIHSDVYPQSLFFLAGLELWPTRKRLKDIYKHPSKKEIHACKQEYIEFDCQLDSTLQTKQAFTGVRQINYLLIPFLPISVSRSWEEAPEKSGRLIIEHSELNLMHLIYMAGG